MPELPPPRFESDEVAAYHRSLPHWRIEGGVYFVTFRLQDSIPQEVARSYRKEVEELVSHDPQGHVRLYCQRIDPTLDSGVGECPLGQPQVASIVQEALRHFDGVRYRLYAFAILPNHVHLVVRPEGAMLSAIVHSWKSYTATRINRVLGRHGPLWQREYFDHLIRDVADLRRFCRYTYENPERAGLPDWPWRFVSEDLPTQDW